MQNIQYEREYATDYRIMLTIERKKIKWGYYQ